MSKPKKKNRLARLVIGSTTIFVVFCLYWAAGRSLMVNTITEQLDIKKSEGYGVVHQGLTIGGFPFNFKTGVLDPGFSAPESIARFWSVKLDDVNLEASVFQPLKWRAYHHGDARLDMRGPGGERWLFDIRPLSTLVKTRATFTGKVKSITIDADRLKAQAVIGTLPPVIAIDDATLELTTNFNDSALTVDISNIFIDQKQWMQIQSALGPRVETFKAEIDLMGLDQLDQAGFSKWSDNPIMKSDNWSLKWGALEMTGEFDLTFEELGPSGIIHAQIKDLDAVIQQFANTGIIKSSQTLPIQFATRMLPVDENGRQTVNITLQDGYVIIFGQRVYKL